MVDSPETYEPRYLAGIVLFNRDDFFEAHEVWESLWQDCCGPERKFYQALIQAAVALYHWGNGNWRGAQRLFHSGRKYMAAYPEPHLGLAIGRFWHWRPFRSAPAEATARLHRTPRQFRTAAAILIPRPASPRRCRSYSSAG